MDSNDLCRMVFDASPDAILIIEGGRFVDCNPSAVRMLRFPDRSTLLKRFRGEHGGMSFHPAELSPPFQPDGRDSFEKAEAFLKLTFEQGSHTFEWLHTRADGTDLLVEVQLTVIARGEKPIISSVWRDIGERKRLQEELSRARRLEAVGRLAGGVAHDFNNLLVVIYGHAEQLLEEIGHSPPDPAHVRQILSSADRAAALTRQLLAFSRGQPVLARPTDLDRVIEEIGSLIRRLIGEDIELESSRSDSPSVIFADPTQIEQLIMNLAANARNAMPGGGTLQLRTGRRTVDSAHPFGRLPEAEYVALEIADSGSGMTEDQVEQAFDPFYTTRSHGGGTGLGLATVHAVAQECVGDVEIDSSPGRGTTVRVLFPIHDSEAPPRNVPPAALPTAGGGHETILIVEDEEPIRALLQDEMRSAGYRVLTARDGQEGLDVVENEQPAIDLILTDMVMPRLSGPQMANRLGERFPEIRVLYMSGYSPTNENQAQPGKDAVILQKPFSLNLLRNEVRRILDRGAHEAGRT